MPIDQKLLEKIADEQDDTEFVCPKCGSRHFERNIQTSVYLCHDEYERGCHWSGLGDQHQEITRAGIAKELLEARRTIINLNSEIDAMKYGWK
jgi:ribosomal protein L37AE/L43A